MSGLGFSQFQVGFGLGYHFESNFSISNDVHFQYHPGKANVVADALSCRLYPPLNCLIALPNELCEEFRKLELNVITLRSKPMLCALEAQPTLIEEIRVAHTTDPQLEWISEEILVDKALGFIIHEDGTIQFHNRCVFQS